MNLGEMDCKSSTNVTKLSTQEINTFLEHQLIGWEHNLDKNIISRKFEFKNFKQTMFFVNAVAYICEKEVHHPDLMLGYNYCMVNFTTHDAGGVSINDIICAYKVSGL